MYTENNHANVLSVQLHNYYVHCKELYEDLLKRLLALVNHKPRQRFTTFCPWVDGGIKMFLCFFLNEEQK